MATGLKRAVATHAARWRANAYRALEVRMQRVDAAARRLTHPAARLAQRQQELERLAQRLVRCQAHRMRRLREREAAARQSFAWRLRRPLPQCAPLVQAKDSFLRMTGERVGRLEHKLASLQQNLEHLDPTAVLERGYAIVSTGDGRIVTDAAEVRSGDDVALTFARGNAKARILDRD